ncbi:L,D-transpeptidase [Liquorilactobacillus satsumensis]|nr:L,D-transpeptidase [Liquorilactobacillus satsumensis]
MGQMNKKKIFAWAVALVLVCIAAGSVVYVRHVEKENQVKIAKQAKKEATLKKKSTDPEMRYPINWRKSSEKKDYPDAKFLPKMWVKVSLKRQRMYIMSGKKTVYKMYISAGTNAEGYSNNKKKFPKGTFKVESKRGAFFYSPTINEGAKYWVSWKGDGKNMIHTVPTDEKGKYRTDQAQNLGQKEDTNGSIRLSVKDAKWFYENIAAGTKLVIE